MSFSIPSWGRLVVSSIWHWIALTAGYKIREDFLRVQFSIHYIHIYFHVCFNCSSVWWLHGRAFDLIIWWDERPSSRIFIFIVYGHHLCVSCVSTLSKVARSCIETLECLATMMAVSEMYWNSTLQPQHAWYFGMLPFPLNTKCKRQGNGQLNSASHEEAHYPRSHAVVSKPWHAWLHCWLYPRCTETLHCNLSEPDIFIRYFSS